MSQSVLLLSTVLQFAAAGLALRLILVTGRRGAWGFIAAALALMGLRRSITFYRVVSGDLSLPPDMTAELVALTISVLMVVGVFLIGAVFAELRQVQAVRREGEEALRESEERFRTAFENVSAGNVFISERGIIELFNAAAETIFGYRAEEVIGRNVSMLMPDPDKSGHDGYLRNYLETGDAKIIGVGREVRGLRKGGETFPMHLVVGEVRAGDRLSFVGSVRDLSEVKTLEAQLRRSQKLEAVGQLTGGIAHDFNNLLAIMMGNLELLEQKAGSDPETVRRIRVVLDAVERGASLTQRLLAFSRQQALSPEATDLNVLAAGLGDMLRRTLGETISLEICPAKDLWRARVDRDQLEHALINLSLNARDAMPDGGELTIETDNVTLDAAYASEQEEVAPGDYVRISVSDSGVGMTPEIMDRAFEPFFTTKAFGAGSGLGLSMVYGFVKQSRGHVTIYSEPGRGTTVKLYLPSDTGALESPAAEETAPAALPRGTERILVVEDDPEVREVPVATLRQQGYDVVEAGEGHLALERVRTGPAFDLLFTDVVLPGGMNGAELAAQVRRHQPSIRVLYTTGYAENAVVHNGQLDSDVSLINKPYRREDLVRKVRSILDADPD